VNNSGAWLLKNSPVGSIHVIGGLRLEVIAVEDDLPGQPKMRKAFRIGRSCTIRNAGTVAILEDPQGFLKCYGFDVEDCVKQFLALRGSM
jgi:hypothetical protein